jgi:hypothetical protein
MTMLFVDSMAVAVGLDAEEKAGTGLWLTLGFVRMVPRSRWPLRWMAKLRVAGSKLMTGLIGRVEATVEAVGLPALHLLYGTIEYTVCMPVTLQNRDLVLSSLVDYQGMLQ